MFKTQFSQTTGRKKKKQFGMLTSLHSYVGVVQFLWIWVCEKQLAYCYANMPWNSWLLIMWKRTVNASPFYWIESIPFCKKGKQSLESVWNWRILFSWIMKCDLKAGSSFEYPEHVQYRLCFYEVKRVNRIPLAYKFLFVLHYWSEALTVRIGEFCFLE